MRVANMLKNTLLTVALVLIVAPQAGASGEKRIYRLKRLKQAVQTERLALQPDSQLRVVVGAADNAIPMVEARAPGRTRAEDWTHVGPLKVLRPVLPKLPAKVARLVDPTYSQMAGDIVAPMFARLIKKPAVCRVDAAAPECEAPAMTDFRTSWMPHDAKALRKFGLGKMRDHLDLFAHAFSFDRDTDTWRALRKEIDAGYEVMGKFKDLYDKLDPEVRADPARRDAAYAEMTEEIDARRAALAEWVQGFSAPELLAQYQRYLDTPDGKLYEHKKQSPFFWEAANLKPKKNRSGVENISRLERGLLELARQDLNTLLTIDKVALKFKGKKLPKDEVVFHNFRKRIRTIGKLAGYFEQIRKTDSDGKLRAEKKLAQINAAVSDLGGVQDMLIAVHDESGKTAKKLRAEINKQWGKLKKQLDKTDLDEALKVFRKSIKKS